ncbi:MAG: DUF2752 domain-containing protein [Thermoguttaceae bacterium]
MNPFRSPKTCDPVRTRAWGTRASAAIEGPVRTVAPRGRLRAAAMAATLLVPLVVACFLEPDARGYGTHQQMGFPPCTLVAVCGIRCPTCGMTTAWTAVVHGRPLVGLAANVGGVLLAFLAIGSVIGLSATACSGRRPRWFPDTNGLAWVAMVIAAVTLIDWMVRLMLAR